mmetsp:Transcript_8838/g.19415  ORF Transcript_8838/g.19415 Transcript_8838/m.19415 type:complete len:479 (+) Transcript_8838:61-1497(+)
MPRRGQNSAGMPSKLGRAGAGVALASLAWSRQAEQVQTPAFVAPSSGINAGATGTRPCQLQPQPQPQLPREGLARQVRACEAFGGPLVAGLLLGCAATRRGRKSELRRKTRARLAPKAGDVAPLSYPGAKGMDAAFAQELGKLVGSGGLWPWEEASGLVSDAATLLMREGTLERVVVPPGGHVTVVGDLHGQLFDLLQLLEQSGPPSPENPYIFNGDFVDRGSYSVETLLVLLAWKVAFPKYVHLARGNHEAHEMNVPYGFTGEVLTKYGKEAYTAFQRVFNYLPLAHVVNAEVLVVHGGLPRSSDVGLAEIEAVDRLEESNAKGSQGQGRKIFTDLMWADPRKSDGWGKSQRGGDLVTFGPDITKRFLADNGLGLLVRSHEVKDKGYEEAHDGRCLTIFSAPKYCDSCDNLGAVLRLGAPAEGGPLEGQIQSFDAAPRPAFYVPAMVYSPMNPACNDFLSEDAKDDIREMISEMQSA